MKIDLDISSQWASLCKSITRISYQTLWGYSWKAICKSLSEIWNTGIKKMEPQIKSRCLSIVWQVIKQILCLYGIFSNA